MTDSPGQRYIYPSHPGITRLIPLPGVNLEPPPDTQGQTMLFGDARCGNCNGAACEGTEWQGDYDLCYLKDVTR